MGLEMTIRSGMSKELDYACRDIIVNEILLV